MTGHECKRKLNTLVSHKRSPYAVAKASNIFERMSELKLEAYDIDYNEGVGIHIFWQNSFNLGKIVEMVCENDGTISAFSWMSMKENDSYRSWVVRNTTNPQDVLQMSLDESLEYIRTFMWSDHDL